MFRVTWLGVAGALASCSIPDTTFHPTADEGGGAKLTFVTQPGTAFTQQPMQDLRVAITDADGNPVPTAGDAITLAFGSNPGGANLLGSLTATAAAGVARFTLVGIDQPGTGYTLVASATGFASVTSAPFNATPPPFTLMSTGIYGGHIDTIAVSPAPAGGTPTIFAGLATGVYKSVNNGATWAPANFGFASAAGTLVADPRNPGVVYAVQPGPGGGVAGGSFYFLKKTVSGGATWLDAGDTTTRTEGATVAVDPANSSIVYVGGLKLYRSTNAGASWTVLGALPYECPLITIDPVNGSLYCAAYERATFTDKGVYKSIDSGATWAEVNNGLAGLVVRNLLLATPNAVFVEASNTLYRSTNGGGTWTSVGIDFPFALAYAPSMPMRMYLSRGALGVAVSDDSGVNFGTAVNVGDVVQALAVDPTNANLVYAAGRDNGVYVSTNGGTSWTLSSVGIATRSIASVAMAPSVPGTVLASADDGVYQTTNGGTSWARTTPKTGILGFDPTTATRVYLCGDSFFTSTTSGASFTAGGTIGTGCQQVATNGTNVFAAGHPGGIRKSVNGGASWAATALTIDVTYGVALGDVAGNVVVTGTNEGMYRSGDAGSSFALASRDLASSLLTDPQTPTRIIAGLSCGSGANDAKSNGGFRILTEGATIFGAVIPGPCVAQLSSNGSAIYAAARPSSVVSTDHGATWTPIGAGIPSGVEVTSIAASADGNTLYLGTTAGLYKSTTGGL